jgi:FKBP-type peptidyl-prolyl cis-trans isomerase
MKKFFATSFFILSSLLMLQAQQTTGVKAQPKVEITKSQPPKPALKNLEDSANCAIGISVGNAYKKDGLKKVDEALTVKGINDAMKGQKPLLDEMQCNNVVIDYLGSLKTKPAPAVQKKPANAGLLKTKKDSVDYAIGVSVANFYKIQGVTTLNAALVVKTVNDVLSGKKPVMNDDQMIAVINNYLNRIQAWKSKPNILAGEQFLEKNKTKQGVITTASGLQYEVITQGTGAKPGLTDTVVCHYRGTFLNGVEFDASYSRGTPIEFAVTGVIKGWTEALLLMPVGSKYKLYVPYQLGYGINDYFAIPGGSMLTFEVELLSIKGK